MGGAARGEVHAHRVGARADDLPAGARDASREPGAGRYFEHHRKLPLPLPTGTDEAALAALVAPHGAHVSRNARRVREDGRAERFVTRRCHRVETDAAVADLERLAATVRGAGHEIVSVEREYVVYDSSPTVDAGWIR